MRQRDTIKKLLESGVVKSGSVDEHLKLLNDISRKYSKARLDKRSQDLEVVVRPSEIKDYKSSNRKGDVCMRA